MYPGTKKRKNAVVGQPVMSTEQTDDSAKPQQQKQKRPNRSTDETDNVSDTKNAVDKINDDAATNNNNDNNNNSNNIIYLEEQKTIHEITLQAWRQRRDQNLTQREAAIVTKRELLDQRDKILFRQKNLEESKMRHISLQSNLIESLNKSRERLRRLTILLQQEEQEQEVSANDENDDDDVIRSKQKLQLSRGGLKEVDNNDGIVDDHQIQEGRQEQNISTKQQELENSSSSSQHHHHLPLAYNSYRNNNSNKQLILYHRVLREEGKKTFSHPRRRSLLSFLPYLDATQVGEYLTLMLREAKTFDDENDNNQDLEKSLRRKLLENTCLDILLLSSSTTTSHIEEKSKLDTTNNNVVIDLTENNSGNDNNKGDDDDNIVDSKLYSINPNISLCPYEMDGVCADDLCPYQHTSKDTKVMARERLPLPSLSSFLSATPIGTEKKLKNGKTQQKTSTIVATVKTNTETAITALEATTEENNEDEGLLGDTEEREDKDENLFGREEDLMMLPPSTSPGDSDEEDENDSDNELDRGDDSDDEAQERSLPLSAPSYMNQEIDLKTRNCDKGAFWWGGKLPSSQETSLPTYETDTPCKKVELSITDILKETFGIVIQTMKTSETSTATTDRLEVKGMPVPNADSSDKVLNWLETLGRLVDASRLAMHGGLDCVALTVSRMYEGDGFLKDLTSDGDSDHLHSLIAFFRLIKSQAEVSCFHEIESQLSSCFQTAFATQMGMSILSWSLCTEWKTLHLADEGGNRTEEKNASPQSVSLEAKCCKDCWAIMRRPPIKIACRMRSFDGEELKHLLLKGTSKDNPAANSIDQLKNLKHLILWAQKQFAIPPYDKLHLSDQLLEERLKKTWLICRKFLLEYQEDGSIEQLDFELQCLKVVIVMGYAIFGSLTSFASAAADGARKKDRKWILISSHSGSNLAAWTILDGSIVRILKDLRKHIADIPLLDLALAPLYSCSVASASFLRNYSAAQQRLVDCLKRTTSSDMLSYSELLWSQLVQLRMSLPNESTSSVSVASNLLTGKKPSKRDDDFSWEQSSVVKEENRLLVAKLESTGISLRHVVLWGDWMLSLMIQNYDDADSQNSSMKLLLLLQADTPNKSDDSTSIHMKKDLQRLQNLSINVGRTYPPNTPLPQLPLFLLHVGHFLTDLNLDRCGLNYLPRSFGLYFPHLKRMNLSHNELTELPESFQNMTRRMKLLEEFYTDHNRLESLPSNIFSNTTGTTSSSSGSGLSSSQQTSSPLRILNLSYNRLTSIPSLVATTLTHLEVLKLNNNLLIDLTMMDLSRLALKLPTLREMTHENQKDVIL